MMKKWMALLLALCTVLLCACNAQPEQQEETALVAEEEVQQTTAPVTEEAEKADQAKPDFSNVNELEPNAEGVYQIYSAEGLANMAKHPEGKFQLIWNVDMQGAEWTPVGTKAAPFTGTLDRKSVV